MQLNPIYARMGLTIFEYMSGLTRDGQGINLGQGFPDDPGPPALIAAAERALHERSNQYPPMAGVPELRDAVAQFYRERQSLDLTRDQVIVTSGATEALAAAILAIVAPGDEVLLFAPSYDAYAPLVRRAGGVPVFVALAPPAWSYNRQAVEAAITQRTRALILNDPLNPTGSVASEAELAMLAEICVDHDLAAICDEVWELVRFDGANGDGGQHRSLLTYPGMAERTVKIGSAGKIFGLTGWKIGWMVAAGAVASVLGRVHQFLTFTTPPALQYAVAEGLAMADAIEGRRAGWAESRARLNQLLGQAGFAVLPNSASWFSCIDLPASGIALTDAAFAEEAVRRAKVASIPVSAFYETQAVTTVLRLCHCKDTALLGEGVARLAALRDQLA